MTPSHRFDDQGTRKMNDSREELGPYWLQTATPFGMTPQPPGSQPQLGWGVLPINQALLAMWDSSKIPIPPAQPPWFPAAAPSADRPSPAVDHLDSAKYWGAMPEPSDSEGQQSGESRGLLYSFSRPHQSPATAWDSSPSGTEAPGGSGGILGSLRLPSNPWLGQRPYDAPNATPGPATQSRNTFDRGDLAKSFGIGLAQGAIGLPGMFGDARELSAHGAQRLADYIAPGYGPMVGPAVSRGLSLLPFMGGPMSSDIRRMIEPVTGPFYKPQTVTGDYARTVGEFVPGMFAPGGALRNAARYVVLPALASETAGQATQGTWAEPWARAIAALAAGGAGAAISHAPGGVRGAPSVEQLPRSGAAGEMPSRTEPIRRPADVDTLSEAPRSSSTSAQ
jgi:hypothetical protein